MAVSGRIWSIAVVAGLSVSATFGCDALGPGERGQRSLDPALVAEGRQIFRYDTFGDETYWTDTLRLNEAVQQVTPATALAVGLKVDADAVPPEVLANADLNDPATTAALLSLDAVVGVMAEVDEGAASFDWASRAHCATPPWTTRWRKGSAGAWTGGRTVT